MWFDALSLAHSPCQDILAVLLYVNGGRCCFPSRCGCLFLRESGESGRCLDVCKAAIIVRVLWV
jgi:hypothetical protein